MTSSGAGDPGRRLGRYHLVEPLGGGPTGEVHRARIAGSGDGAARYAVKIFHAELVADPHRAQQIAAAVRACGKLAHPRVHRVRELGNADGATFAAADLIDGADLQRLMAAGSLPLGAAANLMVQACRAIGYAHGRGLAHLGVCPTNILVTTGGEVRVTDFGLLPARLSERPAADADLAPRVPYLAPEQLGAGPTSPATDVFALGLVAYELWTGTKPFRGGTAVHIAHAIQSEAPAPTSLPKPFAKVLARALTRSPFGRWPDAGAMADAIEAALRASPVPGNAGDAAAVVAELERARTPPAPAKTVMGMGAIGTAGGDRAGSLADTIARDMSELLRVDTPPPERPDSEEPTELGADDLLEYSRPGSSGAVPLLDLSDPESGRTILRPDAAPSAPGRPPPRQSTVPPPLPDELTRPRNGAAPPTASVGEARLPNGRGGARGKKRDDSAWADADYTPLPAPMPYAADTPLPGPMPQPESPASARLPLPPEQATAPYPTVSPPDVDATPPPDAAEPAAGTAGGGSRRWLLYAALFSTLAVGSFLAFDLLAGGAQTSASVATPGARPPDTAAAAAAPAAAAPAPAAAAAAPAAAAVEPDAAVADAAPPDAAVPATLVIDSEPRGAKVYVDGTLIGKTPQTLEGTADSHRLALIRPGYKLHTADIDGAGEVKVKLEEVTPPGGPAGIKVRCRPKNRYRYYVFVDGIDVGQLCPTERIGVDVGPHVVEIYDPVTDSRREFRVQVKQTRLSLRVRVD